MLRHLVLMGFFPMVLLVATGCADNTDPNRKATSPVKGQVFVDGQPAAGVQIQLHDAKGFDTEKPSLSTGMTDDQGNFQITTYELNDGAPEGDYTAVFTWKPVQIMNQGKEAPDRLKGRYATPEKSTIKVKVEKDKETDMGKVELTTK